MARTVKSKGAGENAVGVPVSAPLAASVIPVGSAPSTMANVSAGSPSATNVWPLYTAFQVASGTGPLVKASATASIAPLSQLTPSDGRGRPR